MQLSVLAAENAALRVKLSEREQAARLEMQDLRKFCIASQAADPDKDSAAYKELQQQQQQMMSHLSTVESLANQANASTQHISTRLDEVTQCCKPVHSVSCLKAAQGLPPVLLPVELRRQLWTCEGAMHAKASLMHSTTSSAWRFC